MNKLQSVIYAALCSISIGMPLVAPAADEKRDTLSVHETIARFDGTQVQPCHFKTALCPDRCGHARSLAWFSILRYEKYEKPGEYGDGQTDRFAMPMTGEVSPEVDPARIAIVKTLKPGDWVRLNWVHEYVHREGMSYPERVVTRIERIPDAEREALRKEISEPPAREIAPPAAQPVDRAAVMPAAETTPAARVLPPRIQPR